MARQALADGHEVVLSVYRWPRPEPRIEELERAGAKVLYRRQSTLGRLDRLRCRIERPLASFFRTRPDVICLNQGGTYEMVRSGEQDQLGLLTDAGIPFVVLCHSNFDWDVPDSLTRERARQFFGRAKWACFVSERFVETVRRQLADPLPNATVVCNPVNMVQQTLLPWPAEDLWRLAHVGRLDVGIKGHDILLEALSRPAWLERNWKLRIYGGGEQRGYIEELVRFYQREPFVELCGQVDDIRAVWADSHLALLPSRSESFGLSVAEAMLCGRPALVTNLGGLRDWVIEGRTGFVAEGATAESLANALERAWQARAAWRELGLAAHELAASKMDPDPGRSFLNLVLEAGNSGTHPPR